MPHAYKRTDERNKEVLFTNFAPFIECAWNINNTQIDHAKDLDIVMPMHNLIEFNDNYSKTSGTFWQYYRDEPALTDAGAIENLPGSSASFKSKVNITGKTTAAGVTEDVKIVAPLK